MSALKEQWRNTPRWAKIAVYVVLGLVGAVALGFVMGYAIKLLWNWLMPGIFGLREITYWQAVGIFILGRMLFGSLGGSSSSSGDRRPSHGSVQRERCPDSDASGELKGWKYYDEWWEKEGKRALDSYANQQQNVETEEDKRD